MNEQPKIVMYESDEAAQRVTVTLWKSRKGYLHETEHIARFDGATHKQCECGLIHEISRTRCDACQAEDERERYLKLPLVEWDGEFPLTLFRDDKFFWREDDIYEYCYDSGCQASQLKLVTCKPNYAREIEDDYWCDDLPEEEGLDTCAPEIAEALEVFNAVVRAYKKPISWSNGCSRVAFKDEEKQVEGVSE